MAMDAAVGIFIPNGGKMKRNVNLRKKMFKVSIKLKKLVEERVSLAEL